MLANSTDAHLRYLMGVLMAVVSVSVDHNVGAKAQERKTELSVVS